MRKLKEFLHKTFYVPTIRFRSIHWPTITIPRLSVTLPRLGKWSPSLTLPSISLNINAIKVPASTGKVLASTLALALAVGGFAMYFGIAGVNAAPNWPSPGLYETDYLSANDELKAGTDWDTLLSDTTPAEEREVQSMTLKLNLAGRAGDITLTDLNVGAPAGTQGMTESIKISGDHANSKYLECDTLTISGMSATKFTLKNSEIFSLVISNVVADGTSLHSTLATVSDIEVQSLRGSYSVPGITGSTFDRIIIASTTDTQCRNMTLTNIKTYGFPVVLEGLKIGTLTISDSRYGSGNGIGVPDFLVDSTVKVSSVSANALTESQISIR